MKSEAPPHGWASLIRFQVYQYLYGGKLMSHSFFLPIYNRLHPGQQASIFTGMQQQSVISPILKQPIIQLAFSDDFKRRAMQMKIQSIEEVIQLSQQQLEKRHGFTDTWMDELIEYANACAFLELLDDDKRWEQ